MHVADTLRISTAGSVDDGKSTLIGRLLFDAHGIMEDQVAALSGATVRHGHVPAGEPIDFSLLTDGLIAEREQGITIDVAYRYFATDSGSRARRYILADTPGHEGYTRNMVTGASTADVAIVLVDVTRGLATQSRRHAVIASLLRIPHVIVAVNKMDLVNYDQAAFIKVRDAFVPILSALGFQSVDVVPVSALKGEMVVSRGNAMPWYDGPTILDIISTTRAHQTVDAAFRFPVQRVARGKFGPASGLRGYQGRIEGGAVSVGESVQVFPADTPVQVAMLLKGVQPVTVAHEGDSVTIVLDGQHDISRGDMLVRLTGVGARPPMKVSRLSAELCWMDVDNWVPGRRYAIKHTTRTSRAVIEQVRALVDVRDLSKRPATSLAMNDIALVELATQVPLIADRYADNRATGAFILMDEATNRTVAAGMIVDGHPDGDT